MEVPRRSGLKATRQTSYDIPMKLHCNAVITRAMGAIKSNHVISDIAL